MSNNMLDALKDMKGIRMSQPDMDSAIARLKASPTNVDWDTPDARIMVELIYTAMVAFYAPKLKEVRWIDVDDAKAFVGRLTLTQQDDAIKALTGTNCKIKEVDLDNNKILIHCM